MRAREYLKGGALGSICGVVGLICSIEKREKAREENPNLNLERIQRM